MIITEQNYESILNRIKKFTDKYFMLEKYDVFIDNKKTKDNSRFYFNIDDFFYEKNGKYKRHKKIYFRKIFIEAVEHHFRKSYLGTSEIMFISDDAKDYYNKINRELYEEYKSVILLSKGIGEGIPLSIGDKVRFDPFGFTIFQNDHDTKTVYKYSFIIFSKINDTDELIRKRRELEENFSIYNYEDDYDDLFSPIYDDEDDYPECECDFDLGDD